MILKLNNPIEFPSCSFSYFPHHGEYDAGHDHEADLDVGEHGEGDDEDADHGQPDVAVQLVPDHLVCLPLLLIGRLY